MMVLTQDHQAWCWG